MPTSTMPTAATTREQLPPEQFPINSTPLGKINDLAVQLSDLWVPRALLGQQPADAPARVGYLRNVLLLGSTPAHVKDEVWRFIGAAAREQRGAWNLFALGTAYPGLRTRARRLTPPPTPYTIVEAVHYDLAAEFLFAVHRLRLDRPNVISRFLGAAYDQASGRKQPSRPRAVDIDAADPAQIETALARDHPPTDLGSDEPQDVLRRLVTDTSTAPDGLRLTEQHAALIDQTHLQRRALTTVAADLGLSVPTASKRRSQAEAMIAALLGKPHPSEKRR